MAARRPSTSAPPAQSRPVPRGLFAARHQGHGPPEAGVSAAANSCEGLSGLAQQMCYAVLYDV